MVDFGPFFVVGVITLITDRLLSEQQGEGDDEGDAGDDCTKRAEIGDVYGEMASVLVPRVIPKNSKGEQFRYIHARCPLLI